MLIMIGYNGIFEESVANKILVNLRCHPIYIYRPFYADSNEKNSSKKKLHHPASAM